MSKFFNDYSKNKTFKPEEFHGGWLDSGSLNYLKEFFKHDNISSAV